MVVNSISNMVLATWDIFSLVAGKNPTYPQLAIENGELTLSHPLNYITQWNVISYSWVH